MEQELQALKDELARVRAREKRYKDTTEAQIAALQQQLAAVNAAESDASSAAAELEIRYHQIKDENTALRDRVHSLQKELVGAKSVAERADVHKTELEKLTRRYKEIENENAHFREQEKHIQAAHAKARSLNEKLPGLDGILVAAEFLQNNSPDIRELLAKEGFAPLNNINPFVCRCGDLKILIFLWKCFYKMAAAGADPYVAKECLLGMLKWYNLSNKNQLKILEQVKHSTFDLFRRPHKVLLPGLAEIDGYIHVHPLFKACDEKEEDTRWGLT